VTHTYSLDHVATATESVLVETAAKSELTLISTTTDPKTGAVTSNYVLASGDDAYPATVSYRVENQTRGGNPVRRVSMTFSTWAADYNDVDGITTRKPVVASFSFVLPADLTIELADMDDLIGNAFSFLFASQSAGARNTGYLQKLLYGVPQVI
jgi:hypothetical protein